jgi:hypothetical protein
MRLQPLQVARYMYPYVGPVRPAVLVSRARVKQREQQAGLRNMPNVAMNRCMSLNDLLKHSGDQADCIERYDNSCCCPCATLEILIHVGEHAITSFL